MKHLEKLLRYLLIGRESQVIDKLIFFFSKGNFSGWVLGNRLRTMYYGRINGTSKEPLILVGGYPRSGTTLLQVLLSVHKDIITPNGEVHIFQDIITDKVLRESFDFSDDDIRNLNLNLNRDLVGSANRIIKMFKKRNDGKRVLLKMPKHIFFLYAIFKHFPKSKFIHIIRDGRDCTMSQRKYFLYKGKTEWPYNWCCRQWVVAVNLGKKFRGHKRYKEIKYEDLINNPYETLKDVLDFVGLKPLTKYEIREYYKKIKFENAPFHPNVRSPISKNYIGKGAMKMTGEDMGVFNKIAGKTFKKLGYSY